MNPFIADCIRGGKSIIQESDIDRAEINTEFTLQNLTLLVEKISIDLILREQNFFDKNKVMFLDKQNNIRRDYLDRCEDLMLKVRLRFGPDYSVDEKDLPRTISDAKAIAVLCLLRSIASENLTTLRSSSQMSHAILAARTAVVIDAANVEYFPEQPRMSVDDILANLEGHGLAAIAQEKGDDLKQCAEAIRTLSPIASEKAQSCLQALQME